jgi:CheY-like chemotaxis protein
MDQTTVRVLDDEYQIQESIEGALVENGFSVDKAGSGKEAVEILSSPKGRIPRLGNGRGRLDPFHYGPQLLIPLPVPA